MALFQEEHSKVKKHLTGKQYVLRASSSFLGCSHGPGHSRRNSYNGTEFGMSVFDSLVILVGPVTGDTSSGCYWRSKERE